MSDTTMAMAMAAVSRTAPARHEVARSAACSLAWREAAVKRYATAVKR